MIGVPARTDGVSYRLCVLPEWAPMDGLTIAPFVFVKRSVRGRGLADVCAHEVIHLRDQRRWHVIFFLSYLFLLPLGPGFRAFWEWRAYRRNLEREFALSRSISPETVEWLVEVFTGRRYLWMLPSRRLVERLIRREVARLEAGR